MVRFQLLMRKRGDSWLYVAELGKGWGCQDTRHQLACPHVSDNVRCINDIYIVVVSVWYGCMYNIRRTSETIKSSSYWILFSKATEMTDLCDSSGIHTDFWSVHSAAPCPLGLLMIVGSQEMQSRCA
jgi:hypothetical protein